MKVLVTGASGLVGSALVPFLSQGDHSVTRLVRSKPKPRAAEAYWSPGAGVIDPDALQGLDAVVHLAGETISDQRWTLEKKARIRDSRVRGTRLLAETLAESPQPPKALVCASAIGYYGSRGDEILREDAAPGSGFLAEVCQEWEAAAEPARRRGMRVVHLRTGVVLSPAGGALARMLTPFKLGVGGKIGSGRQYMSWVSIDDLVAIIHFALGTDTLQGPVNAVAPEAVTNLQFTKTLGHVLLRPTLFPMPAFAARLAFGEMADELLLASARVEPARLQSAGYSFRHARLETALRHVLGK